MREAIGQTEVAQRLHARGVQAAVRYLEQPMSMRHPSWERTAIEASIRVLLDYQKAGVIRGPENLGRASTTIDNLQRKLRTIPVKKLQEPPHGE